MVLEEKEDVVHQLIAIEKKLLSVSLNRYAISSVNKAAMMADMAGRHGSLYYAKNSPEGCEPVTIEGDVSRATQADARGRFAVGPSLDDTFWQDKRATMNIDRGPCKCVGHSATHQRH